MAIQGPWNDMEGAIICRRCGVAGAGLILDFGFWILDSLIGILRNGGYVANSFLEKKRHLNAANVTEGGGSRLHSVAFRYAVSSRRSDAFFGKYGIIHRMAGRRRDLAAGGFDGARRRRAVK
jgi:hypothetical protein